MSWSLDARRPDPAKNPEGWYKFWQEELEWGFSRPWERLVKDSDKTCFSEGHFAFMQHLREQTASFRRDMSRIYIGVYSKGKPVERIWEEKGVLGREKILVQALVGIVGPSGAEDFWQYCPDVTKESICSGKGEGLIKLITHFRVNNIEAKPSLKFPILVETRVWRLFDFSKDDETEAARPEPVRSMHDFVLVCRHYFLTEVSLRILTILYGISFNTTYKKRPKMTAQEKANEEADKAYKPMPDYVYAAMEKAEQKLKAEKKLYTRVDICSNCSKAVSSSKRMMCCAGCKKIGRQVMYCSRECQVHDYKHGQPPHKLICSKSLKGVEIPTVPAEPDPFPLYTSTPSPALLLQIYFLQRETPNVDYYLVFPDGRPLSRSIGHPWTKKVFLEARRKAMAEQDKPSVALMEFILDRIGGFGNIPMRVHGPQLEKEYGVKMEDCLAVVDTHEDWEALNEADPTWFLCSKPEGQMIPV